MKKIYYFYSLKDNTHEPIDKIEIEDIVEAIKYFSIRKGLSTNKFMEVFGVGYIKDNSNYDK